MPGLSLILQVIFFSLSEVLVGALGAFLSRFTTVIARVSPSHEVRAHQRTGEV